MTRGYPAFDVNAYRRGLIACKRRPGGHRDIDHALDDAGIGTGFTEVQNCMQHAEVVPSHRIDISTLRELTGCHAVAQNFGEEFPLPRCSFEGDGRGCG